MSLASFISQVDIGGKKRKPNNVVTYWEQPLNFCCEREIASNSYENLPEGGNSKCK